MREAAKKDERLRFTALLHHVSVALLSNSFYALEEATCSGSGRADVAGIRNGPGRADIAEISELRVVWTNSGRQLPYEGSAVPNIPVQGLHLIVSGLVQVV